MAEASAERGQGPAAPLPPLQEPAQRQHPAQPPCWYAVLGVAPGASAEDIRRAYRQAALRLHPDKAAAAGGAGGGGDGGPGGGGSVEDSSEPAAAGGDDFWLVQQAWEVLQDPSQRAAYDRQRALAAAAQEVHVHESVALEEMEPETVEGQACHSWPCRCGGAYFVLVEDAQAAAGAARGAEEGGRGGAGSGGAAAAHAELAVPCSTCSLHIRVLLP
ncbi:hypothetical protein ABPG75_004721 [Micractinium tetrahymenae]